jgi:hypothetical protein
VTAAGFMLEELSDSVLEMQCLWFKCPAIWRVVLCCEYVRLLHCVSNMIVLQHAEVGSLAVLITPQQATAMWEYCGVTRLMTAPAFMLDELSDFCAGMQCLCIKCPAIWQVVLCCEYVW